MPVKPTLFGYGLTTKAIAKKLGGGCTFFDDNVTETYTDENKNIIKPSALFDPLESELEVTTPSLRPEHPLVQAARNLQSEYDYFSKDMPFSIWISGTNGKTTTTQMLTHILEKRGAVSGGNIGTPLADLDPKANIWVLESSSYMLEHTKHAAPNIYLLLPISADHLDWHGTEARYTEAKLSPLLGMKEGELALVPKGLNLPATAAYVVEYDSDAFLENYFSIDASKLNFKATFLQDALLALAVSKVLFDETDYALMNTFRKDAHRQEEFLDAQGRIWVNDSKATNVAASIQALKTYDDKHIHLILGGDDKDADLNPLFEIMQTLQLTLYTIGANNTKLLELAKRYRVHAISSQSIENAVQTIASKHSRKSLALLSPAAASFDQFTSYKARGETFVDLVKKLKDN